MTVISLMRFVFFVQEYSHSTHSDLSHKQILFAITCANNRSAYSHQKWSNQSSGGNLVAINSYQ